jgi:acyl-CoA dehydrogenase
VHREEHVISRTLFDEQHEIFRDSVRRYIEQEIVPHHADWEKLGQVPRGAWLKAGEAGLLCCNVPEEYGGLGGSFLHSAIVIEELARVGVTGPAFPLHSDIVAPYLVIYGDEPIKRRWLPRMASGESLGAIAMTEPSGGSDLKSMRTTAVRDGGEFLINGQKVFITNAQNADIIVLACKTDPTAGYKGISLILVETDRPGFKRGHCLEKIGHKAQDTSEIFFSDVRVPAGNLLGEAGRGFYQLMQQLAQERLVQAVKSTAAAEAALQWTIDYTSQRKAFGNRVADFQNTQFKLADLHASIAVCRVFVDRCLELHVRKALDAVDAAIAKLRSSELLTQTVDECLQLFGGWGYMWEMPIARAYADARMARLAAGTSEMMRQIIARDIFPPK